MVPHSLDLNTTLSVSAGADYLGVSASFLNKLRVSGGGPVFVKMNRRVAYIQADLDAWLENKKRTSTADEG